MGKEKTPKKDKKEKTPKKDKSASPGGDSACDRWFDLRSADNGEVVHGHRFSGSPASIHLLISYQDAAERGKQRSNMAVYIAPRVGREQRVAPAPHPGWTDHPENMTDGDDPWAKFLAI